MNRERKIETEEVAAATQPARARVTPEFERKRDYLSGFLSGEKSEEPTGGAGSDLQASVVEVLKSIYDPHLRRRHQRGRRCDRHHDFDDAALPRRGIDAAGSRASSHVGSGNPRRRREPCLGPAMGPVEDERRSAARAGNVMSGLNE